MSGDQSKPCTKCGTTKPLSEFFGDKATKDRLCYKCKDCQRGEQAKWRAENKARLTEEKRKTYADRRAEILKTMRLRRESAPDLFRERARLFYETNKERVLPLKRIASENRRARKAQNGGTLSKDLAERLYVLQRGMCACGCGRKLGSDFHLDHIMPIALGGENSDSNIQLLIAECNHKKYTKHPVAFMQERGFLL